MIVLVMMATTVNNQCGAHRSAQMKYNEGLCLTYLLQQGTW